MSLVLRTNQMAMKSANQLNKTDRALKLSTSKISSGSRVFSSKDDAAGVSIATRMDSDNVSLKQGVRNVNDGIALIQTAESALSNMQDVLVRMRELSVKLCSDPILKDRVGGAGTSNIYGAADHTIDELITLENELVRIASTASFNRINVLNSSNTSLDIQIGILDNLDNRIIINLASLNSTLGELGVDVIISQTSLIRTINPYNLLDETDAAIVNISAKRGRLGSIQNRLEYALSEMVNYSENLSASQSQILDLDYASESANMTRFQIQHQAGVAALAQAKNIPQSIVNLLS